MRSWARVLAWVAVFGVGCDEGSASTASVMSRDAAAATREGGLDGSPPAFDAAAPTDGAPTLSDAGSDDAPEEASTQDGGDGGGETDAGVPPFACPERAGDDPLPPLGERDAGLVAGGFDFVEGPVWVQSQGALYFSDMDFAAQGPDGVASRMHRFVPGAGASVFVDASGSNGLALDVDGHLLACTHDAQTLSRFDPDTGARTTLTRTYMGDRFNSPNDLVVRSDGQVYFTDPDWQLAPRSSETGITGVYHVRLDGSVELVDGTLDKPNGIALSPDERTLYVSSLGADVLAYPVAPDGSVGSVGSSDVLASPGASDGMTVDCAGNLYVTAGGVQVYGPDGTARGTLQVPEEPSNLAFGGPERRTLYITARTGLYALEMPLPGKAY